MSECKLTTEEAWLMDEAIRLSSQSVIPSRTELAGEIRRLRSLNDELVQALDRLIKQPTNHPISMAVEERKELWAAHEQARAALARAGETQ